MRYLQMKRIKRLASFKRLASHAHLLAIFLHRLHTALSERCQLVACCASAVGPCGPAGLAPPWPRRRRAAPLPRLATAPPLPRARGLVEARGGRQWGPAEVQ